MLESLNNLLDKVTATSATSLDSLPGDASSRKYYRARLSNDHGTVIVCEYEPDQIDQIKRFVKTASWLCAAEIAVPDIIGYDLDSGLVVMEDLGDDLLFHKAKKSGEAGIQKYYRQALDQLLLLQLQPVDKNVFPLKFDKRKFFWELCFFLKHIELLYGRSLKLNPAVKIELRKHFTRLSQVLADEPEVIVHRDFHSKNLLVVDNTQNEEDDDRNLVFWIDFQDARRGLCQYDLVSLLRDSYLVLEDYVPYLYYFLNRRQQFTGEWTDPQKFRYIFDLASIQRNLKAVGTFASQATLHNNRNYLEYIKPTMRYVNQALKKHSDWYELNELLKNTGILSL